MTRHAPTLVLTLALGACGGGGSPTNAGPGPDAPSGPDAVNGAQAPSPAPPSVPRFGTLSVVERHERYHLDAWFADAEPLPGPVGEVRVDDGANRCTALGTDAVPGASVTYGGEVPMTLVSREGEWISLAPQRLGAATVYATELRSVREAFPDDASLMLPPDLGVEASAAVPLSPLAPLEVLVPADGDLAASGGRIEWTGSTDPRDRVAITVRGEALAATAAGTGTAGEAGASRRTLECELADDGAFTLPADAFDAARPWLVRIARVRTTDVGFGEGRFVVEQTSER